jgi:HEAT repeat protein
MVSDAAEILEARVRDLIAGFSRSPDLVKQWLEDVLEADPAAFRRAALSAFAGVTDSACRRCLLGLLAASGLAPACDPAVFSLEEELAITRELFQADPGLDLKLAHRFSRLAYPMSADVSERTLELLSEISNNRRVLPMVIRLLYDPDPRVRSKAALIIGRGSLAPHIAERLLGENDPRVRANAVEALWGVDTPKTRALLRRAAGDQNNRVAANALLALYWLDEPAAIPGILKMARDANPRFRSSAVWVMERTENPRFLPTLTQMIGESEPMARTRVFLAITALNRVAARYAQSPPLRVHILAVTAKGESQRVIRAAIATDTGDKAPDLLHAAVAVSEDSRAVADYSIRKLRSADSISLGLLLPQGAAGDRILAALSAMKRQQDQWTTVRYAPGASLANMQSLIGTVGAGGSAGQLLIHADALGTQDEAVTAWECQEAIARARCYSVAIHSIALGGPAFPHGRMLADETSGTSTVFETIEDAEAACGKIYLGFRHAYEITCHGMGPSALPGDVELEVYAAGRHGVDTFRVAAPAAQAISGTHLS